MLAVPFSADSIHDMRITAGVNQTHDQGVKLGSDLAVRNAASILVLLGRGRSELLEAMQVMRYSEHPRPTSAV